MLRVKAKLMMDIRSLSDEYAVSPQIDPADFEAIKAAGFQTVIDNRPDDEIPTHLHADAMHEAAQAAGVELIVNPVVGGALTIENINIQRKTMTDAEGPVLAYCASGNRSSIVWAMVQAGHMRTDAILAAAERAGYNLSGMRAQIDSMAEGVD